MGSAGSARVARPADDWDPIDGFDPEGGEGPLDEYDCIRDPLISHLLRGDSRDEVSAFLREELTRHFGLQPRLVTTHIIDRIFGWWETVK